MKVIENSVEIWDNGKTIVPEPMMHLERCARVCYQSEGAKRPGESSEDFVNRVLLKHKDIRKNHMSVFEHVALYYMIPSKEVHRYVTLVYSKYSKYKVFNDTYYVSTNMRVLKEFENSNPLTDISKYASSCTRYHDRRYTIYNVCNRGVADEFLRHRNLSFSHESTRYCNYSKDKFGNQLTFIFDKSTNIPVGEYKYDDIGYETSVLYRKNDTEYFDKLEEILNCMSEELNSNSANKSMMNTDKILLYVEQSLDTEDRYNLLSKADNANMLRQILPLSIVSRLVISGFESDIKELLDIRYNQRCGIVHPSMLDQAKLINEKLCLY